MRLTPLLPAVALAACYLAPDTHPVRTTEAAEAGVQDGADASSAEGEQSDAAVAEMLEASIAPECSSTSPCPVDRPLCRDGACVACSADADCARFADRPACGPSGACVVCTALNETACTGATPACDPAGQRCLECVDDADCPSEQRAACGADNRCGSCVDDADCARFGKVCDAQSGSCVECRPATEKVDCRSDRSCDPAAGDCAGTACDPKRLTCTARQRGSVAICQPCSSDSECVSDHRCVPLFFGDGSARKELGTFCMKLATTGCTEPYRAPALMRESASGAALATYCGINERSTSCAAIQALREDRDCANAADCRADGARCESVSFGATKTCTYACSSSRDCPSDVPCGTMTAEPYCGSP